MEVSIFMEVLGHLFGGEFCFQVLPLHGFGLVYLKKVCHHPCKKNVSENLFSFSLHLNVCEISRHRNYLGIELR